MLTTHVVVRVVNKKLTQLETGCFNRLAQLVDTMSTRLMQLRQFELMQNSVNRLLMLIDAKKLGHYTVDALLTPKLRQY